MNKKRDLILTVSGFVVILFTLLLTWHFIPNIIDSQLHKNLDLKEGSLAYKMWKKQPFPLKFKIYFFNVTNPYEVQHGGYPRVTELGPYVYDEYREKVEISVDEDRDLLKYILRKTFFFNKIDSKNCDENDVVTILNAAIVGTAMQVYALLPTAMGMVDSAIPFLYPGTKDIFLTAKVKDILFDGIRIHCSNPALQVICTAMRTSLPRIIKIDGNDFIFSMFDYMNGTDVGPWEMERGFTSQTIRGEVFSYGGEEVLDIWGDEYCNMINGSDTTVFDRVPENRPKRLYSFIEDFCRSLYITFEKESAVRGVKTVRYISKLDSLGINEENNCFCPIDMDEEGEETIMCPPSGLADLTPCLKAPLLISYPHFYLADEKLRNYVSGLNPIKEIHENYVELEPITGTPLSGWKRIQMNLEVRKIDGFTLLENVTRGIFPILWLEEGTDLPDDIFKMIISNLSKLKFAKVVPYGGFSIGCILLLMGVAMIIKNHKIYIQQNSVTNLDTTIPATVKSRIEGYETNQRLYPQIINNNISGPGGVQPRINTMRLSSANSHDLRY